MTVVSAAPFLTSGDLHATLDYIIPVAVIAAGGWALRKLRVVKFVRQFFEDWRGEPARPGVDARPGFPERLQAVEQTAAETHTMATETRDTVVKLSANVDWLLHEMQPNSGSSLRDQMDKVVEHLTGTKTPATPPPPQQ